MRPVELISTPLLLRQGFKKRAGAIYTRQIAEGVLGWLGLNTATKYLPSGHVEVNPIVGVRHQRVEGLVSRFGGEEPHRYSPPTASSPIGYLMPEHAFRTWELSPEAPDAV